MNRNIIVTNLHFCSIWFVWNRLHCICVWNSRKFLLEIIDLKSLHFNCSISVFYSHFLLVFALSFPPGQFPIYLHLFQIIDFPVIIFPLAFHWFFPFLILFFFVAVNSYTICIWICLRLIQILLIHNSTKKKDLIATITTTIDCNVVTIHQQIYVIKYE